MSKNKSSISKVASYSEIGEYWSEHDLGDCWEQTEPVEFEIDIQEVKRYYPLEKNLAHELNRIAQTRGVAVETLLNLWVKEKITEQSA
ncbi:MAG: hypothetical protein GY757_61690 [bacterium]|nr:hypothetical protein [bacterium]